jgi:SAM-dependent methyltransferase
LTRSGVGSTEPPDRGGDGSAGAGAGKYDDAAESFTEQEYGDPDRYFGHRAKIVAELGPQLLSGDAILDLACADGSAAQPLIARGLRYTGVDMSEAMLAAARAKHPGARFDQGDLLTYEPPEPVAATTIFRSLHFLDDRVAFFRHVAGFTEKKLVFDIAPRRYSLGEIRAELRQAGFPRLATRPFLVPQHGRLPAPANAALEVLEPTLVARLLLRFRFSLICAAYR